MKEFYFYLRICGHYIYDVYLTKCAELNFEQLCKS